MDLFQNNNDHRKLALKYKLRKIKMEKGNPIPKYLTNFVQCWDELGSVGIIFTDGDFVSLALLGLPNNWHSYQDYHWKVKISRLGTTMVGSSAGGVQVEHQRWIFIKA
jgi:hypothetical protein